MKRKFNEKKAKERETKVNKMWKDRRRMESKKVK